MYKCMMLIKDHNTKTLVSGDKTTRITLETLEPQQVHYLRELVDLAEVGVIFINPEEIDKFEVDIKE